MEQTQNVNPGKGLGVAGFVISLVAMVIYFPIYLIACTAALVGGGMGLAIAWTIISVLGTVLGVMGRNKSAAVGAKTGLATAGMVIGILAVLSCAYMIWSVMQIHSVSSIVTDGLQDSFDKLKEGLNDALDSIKTMVPDTNGH
jgi:hypothetical protein